MAETLGLVTYAQEITPIPYKIQAFSQKKSATERR